jgi:hypothetical protein
MRITEMSTSNLNLVPNQGLECVKPCVVPVQDKFTFTIYTSTEPLSKIYRTEKGLIQKQAAAQMYKGTAERVTMSFAEFPTALSKATEKQAFGYGVHSSKYPDKVNIVVAGKEQSDKNSIARTQKFYAYTEGPVAGAGMFDHDPNKYGPVMSSVQLVQALIDIHPEIAKAARIVRGSVSAGVHKTDEQPRTDKGFHVYISVKNAADIPRYGKVIFDRLPGSNESWKSLKVMADACPWYSRVGPSCGMIYAAQNWKKLACVPICSQWMVSLAASVNTFDGCSLAAPDARKG